MNLPSLSLFAFPTKSPRNLLPKTTRKTIRKHNETQALDSETGATPSLPLAMTLDKSPSVSDLVSLLVNPMSLSFPDDGED